MGGGLVDQRKWVDNSRVKRKADTEVENEMGERISEQIKKIQRQEVERKDEEWGEGGGEKLEGRWTKSPYMEEHKTVKY